MLSRFFSTPPAFHAAERTLLSAHFPRRRHARHADVFDAAIAAI
jgi:hypothetical protein